VRHSKMFMVRARRLLVVVPGLRGGEYSVVTDERVRVEESADTSEQHAHGQTFGPGTDIGHSQHHLSALHRHGIRTRGTADRRRRPGNVIPRPVRKEDFNYPNGTWCYGPQTPPQPRTAELVRATPVRHRPVCGPGSLLARRTVSGRDDGASQADPRRRYGGDVADKTGGLGLD